jgi:hypothetical protein
VLTGTESRKRVARAVFVARVIAVMHTHAGIPDRDSVVIGKWEDGVCGSACEDVDGDGMCLFVLWVGC